MDFVHDQLFDGRKIRVLTVVDTFTRLSDEAEFSSPECSKVGGKSSSFLNSRCEW